MQVDFSSFFSELVHVHLVTHNKTGGTYQSLDLVIQKTGIALVPNSLLLDGVRICFIAIS